MRQVSPLQAQQAVETALNTWGLPLRMRFDNGQPFACTKDRTVPTALAVWLVSLGIEVILNRPRSPQQNGSVECTQRISSRWANIKNCATSEQLQQALNQVTYDHIHVLRQRSKGDKTRKQQYPSLFERQRSYNPENINVETVKKYLSRFRWARKVYANGRISFLNQDWKIGTQYAHQKITIIYDDQLNKWTVILNNGKVIQQLQGPILNKESIRNLTVFDY